jgi:hypothetical protein
MKMPNKIENGMIAPCGVNCKHNIHQFYFYFSLNFSNDLAVYFLLDLPQFDKTQD